MRDTEWGAGERSLTLPCLSPTCRPQEADQPEKVEHSGAEPQQEGEPTDSPSTSLTSEKKVEVGRRSPYKGIAGPRVLVLVTSVFGMV